jgi:hypothetical protein
MCRAPVKASHRGTYKPYEYRLSDLGALVLVCHQRTKELNGQGTTKGVIHERASKER